MSVLYLLIPTSRAFAFSELQEDIEMAEINPERGPDHAARAEKDIALTSIEAPGAREGVQVADIVQTHATPEEEKRVLRKIDL